MNTLKFWTAFIAFFFAVCAALFPTTASAIIGDTSEWRFNVLLDGKPIGYHRYTLNVRGTERELRSEARFKVSILFITAYRYSHTAEERWQGECIVQLDARTDDNGDKLRVTGTRNEAKFVVATDTVTADIAPCVQTFAYWNPRMLSATQLLNPQTGEYVPVRISRIGFENVQVRNRNVPAERFRIVSEETALVPLQIDLWYARDDQGEKQWIALESLAKDGQRLRYQIQ